MNVLLVTIFLVGYIAIALEHSIRLNKAATALMTGVGCWVVYMFSGIDTHAVNHQLEAHVGEVSGILFFLLGAMTIVELIDAHDGFDVITQRITSLNKKKLLWIIAIITFFLSAILDNLTTAIVMVSILKKLIDDKKDRLLFAGMVIISANAGGAWSPIGDVTTTMLWIGGQITALQVIKTVFLPSLVSTVVPLLLFGVQLKGNFSSNMNKPNVDIPSKYVVRERNIVFFAGILILLLVPIFKMVTHLPPFMGMMAGLGLMWVITELVHSGKSGDDKHPKSVQFALRKIDTPSILFFLGILLSVAVLQSSGILQTWAQVLRKALQHDTLIVTVIGLLSSIVDNVPLVAASIGMYSLEQYPSDHFFWQFLAYCSGTGGSILIIGSAAGVAAMGIEKINFMWYIKKVSWLALLGYLAGIGVYLLQHMFM